MNFKLATAAAAATLFTGTAFAADLGAKKAPPAPVAVVSPWDFAVGGTLTSDYIFRGITQSNHNPSVSARAELRYNVNDMWQLYVGTAGYSIKLSPFVQSPPIEIDALAGVRGTFGAFSIDVGAIGYLYPNTPVPTFSPNNISWGEVAIKPSYTVTDWLTVGANFNYTPSYLATGARGVYLSGTAKVTLPYDFSVSGELGRQWLGTVKNSWTAGGYLAVTPGFTVGKLPDYTYYNVGLSYAYKFVTLDLRYHGTSLSKAAANQLTGINNAGPFASNYASNRIVGSISFDLAGKDLK